MAETVTEARIKAFADARKLVEERAYGCDDEYALEYEQQFREDLEKEPQVIEQGVLLIDGGE
jgi:hypothetical protein